MPGVYEVILLPEGKVHSLYGSRGNYYQLPDDLALTVCAVPVWCRRCQTFFEGEDIGSVQGLEQEVTDYSDINSAGSRRILEISLLRNDTADLAELLAESKTRLEWRIGRIAPPKCLECGTTDIVHLGEGQEIASPCSPGTLTITCVGMCSTAFNNHYYTPEGDRIPMETQPSRWHMSE